MAKRVLNATGKAPTKRARVKGPAAVTGFKTGAGTRKLAEGANTKSLGRIGDSSRKMAGPLAVTGVKTGAAVRGKGDTGGGLKTIKRSGAPQRLKG